MTQWTLFERTAQSVTVHSPPPTDDSFRRGRIADGDRKFTGDERVIGHDAGWVDRDFVYRMILERHDQIQRTSAAMSGRRNVLVHVELRQNVVQASRVVVTLVMDVDVNVAADDHWARMNDEQFEH